MTSPSRPGGFRSEMVPLSDAQRDESGPPVPTETHDTPRDRLDCFLLLRSRFDGDVSIRCPTLGTQRPADAPRFQCSVSRSRTEDRHIHRTANTRGLCIRNQFSQYGSQFSTYSVCDQFATSPPRVYNSNDTVYYGELTLNKFLAGAITSLLSWLQTNVCLH
jgi:hypothetical protein